MKKTLYIILALLLVLILASCDRVKIELQEPEEPVPEDVGEPVPMEPKDVAEEEESSEHPYISITYGRNNPDNFTGRDMVFYTYDLVTKELTEECVIPFDSKYASGVVSKANNTVYYSGRAEAENLSSNDCLIAYDIATGESEILESENFSYNEITMIDENTLLVMAVTNEHPIMPALFDLKTRSFTYMADVNGDPFRLYTSNDGPINYNYNTGRFINIYQNEEESYSSEYLNIEKGINTYIALVNNDLTRDPKKIFAINLKAGNFIEDAVQISDSELLVKRYDEFFDFEKEELITENSFYSLVFKDNGEATFTEAEPPFPSENVRNRGYRTVDGGKTWYLIFNKGSGYQPGLYAYDTETKELTPILLDDSATGGHTVNYSIIGQMKKEIFEESNTESEIPAEEIYSDAFEKWKELGYMEDFGDDKPITQEFIREVYSNYLLFTDKDYDFFDRFVSTNELDDFSKNYFGEPFLSLEADITPDCIDEERGIEIYNHPQLYPSDTIYSFRSTGKDGDNYYFEVEMGLDYEEVLGYNSEKVVRVNFGYDDSKIYFTKQSSVYFDDVLSDFGDSMLLVSEPWNDTKDILVDDLVMWYGYRLQEQNKISDYTKDEKDGLFIHEDEFESVVYDYFGLLPEHLRTSDTYNEAEKTYITPMALYDLEKTEYKVTKTEVDNDTMKIYFSLTVGDNEPEDRILTVDISNEKIRFISYL